MKFLSLKVIFILEILFLYVFASDEAQMEVTTEDVAAKFQMQLFNDFKNNFNKHYATPEAETKAKKSFLDNIALVNEHNTKFDNGETTFRLGISELSDLSVQELTEQLTGFQPINFSRKPRTTEGTTTQGTTTAEILTCEQTNQIVDDEPGVNERVITDSLNELIPDSIDWRFAFQSSRFQDYSCESCWVFTTIALVESHFFLRFNQSISLSEQYLLDCVPFMCNGGHFYDGLEFITNNGIPLGSYNSTNNHGRCPTKFPKASFNVTSYTLLKTFDEEEVIKIVGKIGPVAVGIDGSSQPFIFYKSGIFTQSRCSENKNHAVIIVGFGTENGKDFWWIRNSWGKTWGINGYAKIDRNKQDNCGMAEYAMYPNAITV